MGNTNKPLDELVHATGHAYNNGCRCDPCIEFHNDRCSAMRYDRETREPPADAHGKATTYSNWRCRCKPCIAANSAKSAVWREKKNKEQEAADGRA